MKTICPLLVTAALSCLTCQAESVDYRIDFTLGVARPVNPGTVLPSSGSFAYDPASGFSNFVVVWNSVVFDLTPQANAPQVVGPTGCQNEGSSFQYGFLLTSKSVTGCTPFYFWQGEDDSLEQFFSFAFFTNTDPLEGAAIEDRLSFSTGHDYLGIGEWTISPTPEPVTWGMLAGGGLVLAAFRRRRPRRG